MTKELVVADVLEPIPSIKRMLGRAIILRCPRCGHGGQFHHWLRRAKHCPGCGYTLERQSDFFYGAYTINLCVTLFTLFGVLIVAVLFEAAQRTPPAGPIIAAGLFCALVFPLVFYPFSFTLWAVIDLASEPLELHEIAGALDNLDADRVVAQMNHERTSC